MPTLSPSLLTHDVAGMTCSRRQVAVTDEVTQVAGYDAVAA
jgi:hypothetical protein